MRRINKSLWALIGVGILGIGGVLWWWLKYQDDFVTRFAIEHSGREGHFANAKIESVHLDNRVCTSVVFDHCNFMYSTFKDTDFSGSQMTDSFIFLSRIENCNLEHADLRRTGWIEVVWVGCNMGFADLRAVNARDVHIIGCDLHAAKLDGIDLTDCRYDSSTKWPPDFNPTDSGAVLDHNLH